MRTLKIILSWVITLLVPAVLIMTGIIVLLSPIYIQVEYRMPYFPDDPYDFTQEERLYWADISIDYLLNSQGIDYLGNLQFPDGQQAAGSCEDYVSPRDCTYFYNDRELSHMVDVKIVLWYALAGFMVSLIFIIALGFWAKKSDWWDIYKRGLFRGGWLTVGLIAALMVYLAINFNALFVTFHEIFFASGTWTFRFSDSLIRLFPVVFWRDAFIWIGAIALGGGVALGYFLGRNEK